MYNLLFNSSHWTGVVIYNINYLIEKFKRIFDNAKSLVPLFSLIDNEEIKKQINGDLSQKKILECI